MTWLIVMIVSPFALGAVVLAIRDRMTREQTSRAIIDSAEEIASRNNPLRERYGKPSTWIPMEVGPAGKVPPSYVVWFDQEAFKYIVEVYDAGARVLRSEEFAASAEPRFGIDVADYAYLFGESGVIARLTRNVEQV